MLEKLLLMLAEGRGLSTSMIAARLQVSQALVLSMVDDLERMGYLRKVQAACGEPCSGCSLHTACGLRGAPQAWLLTKAATSLLHRQPDKNTED